MSVCYFQFQMKSIGVEIYFDEIEMVYIFGFFFLDKKEKQNLQILERERGAGRRNSIIER